MTTTFLLTLLRTTLVLTLCGGVCFLALRKIESRLPKLSRLLWLAVLLTGWFWLQPVIEVPVAQTAAEEQSRNLQIAEKRPVRAEHHSPGQAVLRAALGSEPPNEQAALQGQGTERHIALPLQGSNLEEDPLTQGVALGYDVSALQADSAGNPVADPLLPSAVCRLLSYIWLGGMLFTILLAASGYIRILWLLRKAELADDTLATPWKNLLKEHGID